MGFLVLFYTFLIAINLLKKIFKYFALSSWAEPYYSSQCPTLALYVKSLHQNLDQLRREYYRVGTVGLDPKNQGWTS